MSRVEKLLLQMSLREPSDELDQRVVESIAPTPMKQPRRRRPSWWGMLAACGACLLIGIFAGRQWPIEQSGGVSSAPATASTDIPDGTEANEATPGSARAVDPGLPAPVELAAAAGVNPRERTMVSDGTFLLINGQPVRRHRTFRTRRVRVYSAETDQFSEIEIPIRRDVVITSRGI